MATTFTTAATSVSAGAATITPALPTVMSGGAVGVLLAVCLTKNNATHATATTGWNLVQQVNSGAGFTVSLWKALQGAAAPVFTWTGSVACSAQVTYAVDPENQFSLSSVSLLGAAGTGTTSPHTSAGGTTTFANALALYFDGCATNTTLTTPAGWTSDFSGSSATSGTAHNWGHKAIATSGTASGAISTAGGAAAYVQFQIQIIEATPTAGFQVEKADVQAWAEPQRGFNVVKADVQAWTEPKSGFSVAKAELLAWLEPGTMPSGSANDGYCSILWGQ